MITVNVYEALNTVRGAGLSMLHVLFISHIGLWNESYIAIPMV